MVFPQPNLLHIFLGELKDIYLFTETIYCRVSGLNLTSQQMTL